MSPPFEFENTTDLKISLEKIYCFQLVEVEYLFDLIICAIQISSEYSSVPWYEYIMLTILTEQLVLSFLYFVFNI